MHEVHDILRSPLAMEPGYARALAGAAASAGPVDAALAGVAWPRRGAMACGDWFGMIDDPRRLYAVSGGVAVVALWGPLVFNCPLCALLTGGTRTETLARAVDAAAADGSVRAILIDIDSPGGQVAGMDDAIDAVTRARAVKPVIAAVHARAYSGAYWVAGVCDEVVVTPTAELGSIGVFMVVDDSSAMARRDGVTRHLVASRDGKGLGLPGVPVSETDLERVREEVGALDRVMLASIARGRRTTPERIAAAAEQSVYVGAAAVAAGLADRVEEHAATLARLGAEAGSEQRTVDSGQKTVDGGRAHGTAGTTGAQAMTLKELKDTDPEGYAALLAEATAAAKAEMDDDEEENGDAEAEGDGGEDGEEEKEKKGAKARGAGPGGGAQAASVKEILAAFTLPGESRPSAEARALAADCAADGLTLTDSLKRFMAAQASRAGTPGAAPLAAGGRTGAPGSAAARWDAAVKAEVAAGKSRAQAVRDVAARSPDLRKRMVAEHNRAHGRAHAEA